MVEAMVKYATSIVVAHYRKNTPIPGSEDPQVEQRLRELAQPSLEHWVGVLDFILNKYRDTSEAIIGALAAFYFERNHQDDPIARAILKLQEWLGPRLRLRPPFAYRDLIDSVVIYGDAAEGWDSATATLSEEKYQARSEVLRPALEQMARDLRFLTNYPLVYIGPDGRACDAMGDAITRRSEPLRHQAQLEAGHLYLCRRDRAAPIPSSTSALSCSARPVLRAVRCASSRPV